MEEGREWRKRGRIVSIAEKSVGSYGWLSLTKMPEISTSYFEQYFNYACIQDFNYLQTLQPAFSDQLLSSNHCNILYLLFLIYKQKTMLSSSFTCFEFLHRRNSSLRLLRI